MRWVAGYAVNPKSLYEMGGTSLRNEGRVGRDRAYCIRAKGVVIFCMTVIQDRLLYQRRLPSCLPSVSLPSQAKGLAVWAFSPLATGMKRLEVA